jgi:branched-chain amino acid transport system substrate-binding protein
VDAADRLRACAVRGRRRRAEAQRRSDRPKANVASIAATNLDDRSSADEVRQRQDNLPPFARKNVAKTPLVGGQWRLGADGKYDIVIVDNQTAPNIPTGGKMEPIA